MGQEDRGAFFRRIENQFEEWDSELKVLQAKVERAGAEAKVRYREKIAELTQKRNELQEKARRMKDSAAGAWETLRDELESSWDGLKSALKTALDGLSES